MSQTKTQLVEGLNINTSAPATALQIDASGNINLDSNTLYVDATNNRVGLGTSSPATALHVSGAGTQRIRITGTGVANATLSLDAPSGYANYIEYGVSASTPLRFYDVTAAADRMIIDTSGRVGIGTTSPNESLHITSGALRVASNSPAIAASDGALLDWVSASGEMRLSAARTGANSSKIAFITYNSGSLVQAVNIDSSGRVGIGTTSPNTTLHVNGNIRLLGSNGPLVSGGGGNNIVFGDAASPLTAGTAYENVAVGYLALSSFTGTGYTGNTAIGQGALRYATSGTLNTCAGRLAGTAITTGNSNLCLGNNAGSSITTGSNNVIIGNVAGTSSLSNTVIVGDGAGNERFRVDSSGRLLVGTSSAIDSYAGLTGQKLSVAGNSYQSSTIAAINYENDTTGAGLNLGLSRNTTVGSQTIVQNGDQLGMIRFSGSGGTAMQPAAFIRCEVDGTPSSTNVPGRLLFMTTASGGSLTERMRIDNAGRVLVGGTNISPAYNNVVGIALRPDGFLGAARDGDVPMGLGRKTNDGNLLEFFQDGSLEGSISVSGTTVSYNGAHLSRWSQLPGGATREEILRGTVLSNIDEMCDWGEEDNEQLNRMKVSDVEGDPNVAGVFQAWDDDDDTYTDDFYCAMTGDFIIRIAEGVTVQRGDLLMSAGDGTAKPQDDDIIRSKTIAKVTSNHITCTYADGSYCVPCVLMAC